MTTNSQATPVVLVTGMSGAGKSSALRALEDLGFEAIDNVPQSLMETLISLVPDGRRDQKPLALGIDIRTREFSPDAIARRLDSRGDAGDPGLKLLFLDCDDEVLARRFTETRRRHPLSADRPVTDGIQMERRQIAILRDKADLVIDTTGRTLGDLKTLLESQFAAEDDAGLSIFVTSFSFAKGLPREADIVFDVRFLKNPHYDQTLRPLTGRDRAVGDYVSGDPGFAGFFDGLTALLEPLLPRYRAEGKSYLTIAVGCTGGWHRSVFVAERLRVWFEGIGHRIHLTHRDLNPS